MWWVIGLMGVVQIILMLDILAAHRHIRHHRTHEHLSNEIIADNMKITLPPGTEEDFGH